MGKAVIVKILASFLNLEEILRRSKLRIELPHLSSNVIVQCPKPWIPSFGELELPHSENRKSITFASGGDEWL